MPKTAASQNFQSTVDVVQVLLGVRVPDCLAVIKVENRPFLGVGDGVIHAGIDGQWPQPTRATVPGGKTGELLGIERIPWERVVLEVDIAVEFPALVPLLAESLLDALGRRVLPANHGERLPAGHVRKSGVWMLLDAGASAQGW